MGEIALRAEKQPSCPATPGRMSPFLLKLGTEHPHPVVALDQQRPRNLLCTSNIPDTLSGRGTRQPSGP